MGPGFYKLDGSLFYAAHYVKNKDYELYKDQKDSYSYPVNGWYWFNTIEEACENFQLNINDYVPPPEESQTE